MEFSNNSNFTSPNARYYSDLPEQAHIGLRRPFLNPEGNNLETGNQADQLSNILSATSLSRPNTMPTVNSNLSVNAAEFVPRFNVMAQPPHQMQNNIPPFQQPAMTENTGQNNMQEFGMRNVIMPELKYVNDPVILQVDNMVVNLTLKPHRMDQIATQMTSTISWRVKEEGLMREIVFVIFEQGVGAPNFRMSGGRLSQHLSLNIKQNYEGKSFKTLLLQKCQEEFENTDYYLEADPTRMTGYTLFLVEIFTNVITPNRKPIIFIGDALCSLLEKLIVKQTPDYLKCAAHVLKACGFHLDYPEGNPTLENVMGCLKDVTLLSHIPPNISTLLLSVIELRAANWGRPAGGENPSSPAKPPLGNAVPHLGMVIYDKDGTPHRVDDDDGDEYSSDVDDILSYGPTANTEELEGEALQAYEKFLEEQEH